MAIVFYFYTTQYYNFFLVLVNIVHYEKGSVCSTLPLCQEDHFGTTRTFVLFPCTYLSVGVFFCVDMRLLVTSCVRVYARVSYMSL